MKSDRYYAKKPMWLILMLLFLMMVLASPARAAPTPSFSGTATGTANNLTLNATLNIADADVGKNGNIYIAFAYQNNWFFNSGGNWGHYGGGVLPIYAATQLSNRSIEIARNVDLSKLIGGEVYAGYGLSESDMLANGKYGLVYKVMTDTTAPTILGSMIPNGASGVPISMSIGATFSEAMSPASISTTTVTLMQGATPVPGKVSYSGVDVVFLPNNPLANGSTYTATIKGGNNGVKDLADNAMQNDYVWSWSTNTVTLPIVVSTVIANGASGVALNSPITATFNEALNLSSVNAANFALQRGTTPVSGTFASSGLSVTFLPANPLSSGSTYTATLRGGNGGIQNLAGDRMASDYTWSWTTIAPTAPMVTSTVIANGASSVALDTAIAATFSVPMDATSINTQSVTLLKGTTPIDGSVSYTDATLTFLPASPLLNGNSYTATIKGGSGGVKDVNGTQLATDYVWSWSTVNGATVTPTPATAPMVISTVIANGATGVAINTPITATFSTEMNAATLNTASVTLLRGTTPVSGTLNYSGVNLTFLPDSPLLASSSYTATIKGGNNGAKDLAGTALVSDFVWSWTTGTTLAPVLLGTAGNFAVLAKTGISSVPASVITGDIGVSPAAATYITGFSLIADATNVFSTATQVVGGGKVYAANMAVPTPSNLTTAILDMQNAYTDAAGRPTPDFLNLGTGNIGGRTLAPGLYNWGSAVIIPTDVVLSGGPNDVWILQMSGDLSMSANKNITLSGGALAKNIFWQVAGKVTIAVGAHFEGIILSQTGVTMQTGASMNGRVLAQTAVALDSATITKPAP